MCWSSAGVSLPLLRAPPRWPWVSPVITMLVAAATWTPGAGMQDACESPEEADALKSSRGVLRARHRAAAGADGPTRCVPVAILLAAVYLMRVLPPIARAATAIAATLFCPATSRHSGTVAFWGLVALALPVLPLQQFINKPIVSPRLSRTLTTPGPAVVARHIRSGAARQSSSTRRAAS